LRIVLIFLTYLYSVWQSAAILRHAVRNVY